MGYKCNTMGRIIKKKKIIPIEPDWERVVVWLNKEIDIQYRIIKNKRKKKSDLDITKELLEIEKIIRMRDFTLKTKLIDKL